MRGFSLQPLYQVWALAGSAGGNSMPPSVPEFKIAAMIITLCGGQSTPAHR
jgi:hypothetical protein